MNKEYTSTHIEYLEVPNYIEPKERLDEATSEFFEALGEYNAYGKEYVDSIEQEIVIVNSSSSKTNEKEQKKKKQNHHKKLLQNMVYTVASVAAVLVLTQTAEPNKFVSGSYLSQIISEQEDRMEGNSIVSEDSGEQMQVDVEENLLESELDGNSVEDENNTKDDNNALNDNSNQDENKPDKIKGNKLSFVPSDITFMGYPVTENHYEEWKAALNFSGDDGRHAGTVDSDNEFCDELVCTTKEHSPNIEYLICLYDTAGDYDISFLSWIQLDSKYVFGTNITSNWRHISEQYVSGPFYIGQTFDEALLAAGYNGEITYDNNPIYISEDITIIGSTSSGQRVTFYFEGVGDVMLEGIDNIVENIVVSSKVH